MLPSCMVASGSRGPTTQTPEPLCQYFKLHIHELNFSLIGKLNNEKQLHKDAAAKPRSHP